MNIRLDRIIEIFFIWVTIILITFSTTNLFGVVFGESAQEDQVDEFVITEDNSVTPMVEHFFPGIIKQDDSNTIDVAITAYSSSIDETDSDPFITASGEWVRDGIVAANFLPFGTEIRIPELYGNKVFIVKDRMHPRKKYQVDIWFPSKQEAIEFGAYYTYIELVEK